MSTSLGTRFVELAGPQKAGSGAELDDLLEATFASARERFPRITLPEDVFLRYLAARADAGSTWREALEALEIEELYVTCGCALGDRAALSAFDEEFLRSSAPAIRRIDGSSDFIAEVQQVLREKLLWAVDGRPARIETYSGRGSLRSWVCAGAVRTALNLKAPQRPDSLEDSDWERIPEKNADTELGLLRTRFRGAFAEAFAEAVKSLNAQERQLLRLHLLENLSIDKLAVIYQAHRSTTARWVVKAREALEQRTRDNLAQRLQVGSTELDELLTLVRSQVDLSLRRVLREA